MDGSRKGVYVAEVCQRAIGRRFGDDTLVTQ